MPIRKLPALIVVLTLFFALGCQSEEQVPSPSPVVETSTPPVPTEQPLSLSGLIYGTQDEATGERVIWQVGDDDAPHVLLSGYRDAAFSPDGMQAVYYDNIFETGFGCTWLADFTAQKISQLDCASIPAGLPAVVLGWVPNDPNTMLAVLKPTGGEMGSPVGYVGTISNGKLNVIDGQHLVQDAVISPNGQTIAYGSVDPKDFKSKGWLFSKETGVVEFDPKAYGVEGYSQVGNPAWSPDGSAIAWGLMKDDLSSAVVVFDLQSKTANVLYTYQQSIVADVGVSLPAPHWSVDGQWLILHVNGNAEESGDWFFRVSNGEKHKLNGELVSLNPNGEWVLYVDRSQAGNVPELRVEKIDGSDMHVLGQVADGQRSTLWSRDGKFLVFGNSSGTIQWAETGKWDLLTTEISAPNIALLDWVTLLRVSPEMLASIPVPPTPTNAPEFSCPAAPRPRIQVGDQARVTFTDGTATRLRSVPIAGDNVIDKLPEGTEFVVIEGPVCYPRPGRSDAFVYWKVHVSSRNVTGWLAEGDANGYFIEPLK